MQSFFRQLPEVPHRVSRALFIGFVLLASYSVVLMAGTYGPGVAILAAAVIVKCLLKRVQRGANAHLGPLSGRLKTTCGRRRCSTVGPA